MIYLFWLKLLCLEESIKVPTYVLPLHWTLTTSRPRYLECAEVQRFFFDSQIFTLIILIPDCGTKTYRCSNRTRIITSMNAAWNSEIHLRGGIYLNVFEIDWMSVDCRNLALCLVFGSLSCLYILEILSGGALSFVLASRDSLSNNITVMVPTFVKHAVLWQLPFREWWAN